MRARHLAFAAGALLLGVTLVAFRGDPRATSDQGVFLSVAARMLDGDRLYADVIDNKDPLFFYGDAAALAIGGWRGPFALDGLWLALAAISVGLLLRELGASTAAIATGALVYPLSLTAAWYQSGLSMLGALALAPLAAWLWVRGSSVAAGVVVGLAMLFKINLALVVVAPIAAFLLLGTPGGARLPRVARFGAGFLATLVLAVALLVATGAFQQYLDVLGYNVHYSGSLNAPGPLDGVEGHLRIVRDYFHAAGRWQYPAALTVIAAFGAFLVVGWTSGRVPTRTLSTAAAATLVATLVTLALTALWGHHLQMLAYPLALGAAAGVVTIGTRFGSHAGAVFATACVAFAAWASVKHEVGAGVSARSWSAPPISVSADELEKARLRFYPARKRVTYMVFGGNSENAHAVFIDDAFDLSCRWFHLYPFSLQEQLTETLDFGARGSPLLVLVTLGFFDDRARGTPWAAFVRSARRFLEARYEKVAEAFPGFQVWKRTEPA